MIIDSIMEEINDLKEAKNLLEKIYSDIGPYKDEQVSDETWKLVRDYFKFDDSE